MATPYTNASEVLADRIVWATATLGKLLDEAVRRGWITGSVGLDAGQRSAASDLRNRIGERLASTTREVRIVPFEWMRYRLGLSEVQSDALWLLACVEIDPGVARLAHAFGVADCPDLSVQIVRRLLPLTSDDLDRLSRSGLIETGAPARPSHRRSIRVADRVLELARGELRLAPDVARIASLEPPIPVDANGFTVSSESALVVAIGIEGAGRTTLLRRLAGVQQRGTLVVRVADLATDLELLRSQLRAIVRESRLLDVIPLLRDLGSADVRSSMIEAELLEPYQGIVFASAQEAPSWVKGRPLVVHDVEPLDTAERERIWRAMFGNAPVDLVREVAVRYAISPGAIVAAAENVKARTNGRAEVTIDAIHAGLRDHLGQRLGKLARRIEWKQSWDDLVLPDMQREQVDELIARVRHRRDVLEGQGFGDKVAKGHGLVALLSGEPGTGKTMVAGLVASALGLDLYQVDLSVVVSKYIGETEKGLARLFDAAESGQVVLLFDEADALFAKRSEVKSSNDRYANLETNYLLQRLEAFGGISILTTNNEAALDDAFRRRIALHIKFPMPEEDERARLWRAMFPARASLDADIDVRKLAHDFEMSGGHIKNAVLRAAYLAAVTGDTITMAHLRRAARAEYEAMGRIVTSSSTL